MRDLLFKSLTSEDKKRKIIASSEIVDNQGVRSTIHRHFVYIVKEIKEAGTKRPLPYLYVLKERNSLKRIEKFFCRIKGSVYVVSKGRLFLILYMHSLKIYLSAIPQDALEN
ncbi:MAG: hypothetical protein NC828_05655 [Candidatus Omnitrophica bacterium]|nr:hypothetical protein [Candidatus Omnitrophota bacterium]